ncbi:hypothetical protein LF887_09450 [Chryseobacterium sp. MEBOG06]|uniref:hypothetical protein n=1 Tax=unclassified Chryseobacterium TaxID=2593645 RepID=UPI001F33AD29|nr:MULTISPECIES: hypothetical protein [unclassified Chryseobacterium]UKB85826.1 hypothetical protein LF887_09450 [Chryseobacterium sp. MEBOG06]
MKYFNLMNKIMNKKNKPVPISFGDGCAVSDDIFCVTSVPDNLNYEIEFTRIFILNLSPKIEWTHHDIPNRTIISIVLRPKSDSLPRACYALSDYGQLQIFNSTEIIEEEIPAMSSETNRDNGLTFSAIRYIGQKAYACGAIGRIYRRDDKGWVQIAAAIADEASRNLELLTNMEDDINNIVELTEKAMTIPNFEYIAGLSDNEIYACGNNGIIIYWNGISWNYLKSSTKEYLHYIHCVSADQVYICGDNGTLLSGNATDGFCQIKLDRKDLNFWVVQNFKGIIYVGTTSGLFQLEGVKLIPVNFGLNKTFTNITIQALEATESVLWAVTDKFLLRLENSIWKQILHPDNV